MGKGVKASVVFVSVMPAGALTSVALHHCWARRTGVLPCLQLVSIFLVFLVSVFCTKNADARMSAIN